MSVTIRKIADEVGLSMATVSCVLNGKGERFSDATVARVQEIADRLGYRPNAFARAMREGRYSCLALLSSPVPGRSHYPQELRRGIQSATQTAGFTLLDAYIDDANLWEGEALPRLLREWMADGFLINFHKGFPEHVAERIRRRKTPAVWLNAEVGKHSLHPGDRAAGRRATEILLERGHRRIAYLDYVNSIIAGEPHFSAVERPAGYADAMRAAGARPRFASNPSAYPVEGWRSLARQLLGGDDPPTAIVAYSPGDALQVWIAAVADLGLSIPDDCSLITIGDQSCYRIAGIPIDTVVLPWYEVGVHAVDLLVAQIEGRAVESRSPGDCAYHSMDSVGPPPGDR